MKKTLLIIAALVLALGMTQCKKAEKPQATTGDPIHVTFTATYGGERTSFNPEGGSFVWSTGGVTEYIYVGGSTSGYLGTLSAEGNGQSTLTFTGTLTTTPNDDETLHFFYLGKGEERSEVTSLDFSTQKKGTLENLTNYHVAVGSQKYNGSDNFSAYLEPLVAFAYLDLSGFEGDTVYVHGDDVYATATVDFSAGTITGQTAGYINVGKGTSDKYVALIPSTASSTTVKFDSNGKSGSMDFMRGICAGKYYANNNAALNVSATPISVANDGTIPGLFSVEGTNGITTKMVRFSKGNLQATTEDYGSNWNWHFAANEYEYIGEATANTSINGYGTVSDNGTVDLFGWSTGENYGIGGSNNGAFVDWGGAIGGGWRTLKNAQWNYLFTGRTNAENLYGFATINGTHGIIVLPDGSDLDFTDSTEGASWDSNLYNSETWNNIKQSYGAVFLPAAGSYSTSFSRYTFENQRGYYWSSSANPGSNAYIFWFFGGGIRLNNESGRTSMNCVRLVRDVD